MATKNPVAIKGVLSYGCAYITDIMGSQFFSFLIFTFYFAVIGIDTNLITIAFIIWTIWNAVNDPLMGSLSDRTMTRWGKRKPWIVAGIVPMCFILFFIWMPPMTSMTDNFWFMLVMLLLFDTFFTMYSLNQTALFPEMYQDLHQRAKANQIIQVLGVIALIVATLLPGIIIPDYSDVAYKDNYLTAGLLIAIICGAFAAIFILTGIKERPEFSKDAEVAPSFLQSLKLSLKNKSFATYIIANFTVFYVFGMLPVIAPLYGRYVLGLGGLPLSSLLGIAFISAAAFIGLWNKVSIKHGIKKGQIMAMITFIITLIPFGFITEIVGAIIAFVFAGIGVAGALFFRMVVLSTIVDEDELTTGVRREGGYMGINAFFTRLTTIAIVLTVNVVFTSTGWSVFDPVGTTEETIIGLRVLICVFPAIALAVGILLGMRRFPIDKARYEQIKEKINALHEEKKRR